MDIGANFHALWADSTPANRAALISAFRNAGVTWARIDVAWAQLQPQDAQHWDPAAIAKLGGILAEFRAAGLKVLLLAYWPPGWASVSGVGGKNQDVRDAAAFGRFAGSLATRFPGAISAVEMLNEPDLSTYSVSQDPVLFGKTIAAAYPAFKESAPSEVTFVMGAPSYLGQVDNWLNRALVSAAGQYDAFAIHPYVSPSDLPPDSPITPWSIRGIPQVQALSPNKPLWVTEFGWSAHATAAGAPNWKRGVTEAQQADFTGKALDMFAQFGVSRAFLYCDRDVKTSDLHEASFGGCRYDLSQKPVMKALADAAARLGADPRIAALQAQVSQLLTAAAARRDTDTAAGAALNQLADQIRAIAAGLG